MSYAIVVNVLSLVAGAISAIFWVLAATRKAPPPEGYEGVQNAHTWKATIVDGGELYGTLRLQAKWNSRAAWAASAAVALQIIYNLIS